MSDCDHSGSSCPVHHGLWDDSAPFDLDTVLLCLYGGCETKDGGTFDATDAKAVVDRVWQRLSE